MPNFATLRVGQCCCRRLPVVVLAGLIGWFGGVEAQGQVPQIRTPSASPIHSGVGTGNYPLDIPQTNLAPVGQPLAPPASQLADPYAPPPRESVFGAPPLGPSSQNSGGLFGMFSQPASSPVPAGVTQSFQGSMLPPGGGVGQPTLGPPTLGPPTSSASGYGPGVYGPGAADPGMGMGGLSTNDIYGAPAYPNQGGYGSPYPSSVYPSTTPSTLFPEGIFAPGATIAGPPLVAEAFRLFQGPRFRYTYTAAGDSPTNVNVNDFDFAFAFAFPRFVYSTQPLFVIPSFSLHLWDGPDGATGADLPSKAYSAFVDVGWESDRNQMIGTEFGVRVGVFSDFDTYNSRSLRVLGRGLVHFRLSPASTFRAGVYYLDRNDYKLIPAAGLRYQPDPFNIYDLFFPLPKVSHYWRTIGTQDVWWYVAGGVGGGSWTIERTSGMEDSIDINDLRVYTGIEFGLNDAIRVGRRTGFVEFGYAFDREVTYYFNPQDNFDPGNAFVFRAGFGY